ncbi:MAG TPA: helix-hairpin-helix domain-containing protein [Candidatus Bathyarchaeia archaeon]|nr:helix-hairpin-helix domain-containing protein [Candidatus Bathyarchaeia archaeon]
MRLDYMLYGLAAVFFLITAVSFVMLTEQPNERNLWVVGTVVLGLLSIGLGYYQRQKARVEARQPAAPTPQVTTVEAPKEEKVEAAIQAAPVAPAPPPSAAPTIELTQVKGIGEKRAAQLKALGINSVDELAATSAEDIAMKLKISPKIVEKWVAGAKELVK